MERTTGPRARRRLGQVVFALAMVSWACASAPAPQTPEPGATQEVLAARIRTVTIGEARPEQEEALRQIAAIEPGQVDSDLRAAMAEAFVVMRGRQEFEGVRHTLENLLAPLYSTNELAAALSGIPSRPGPTGEETTAAILAARLAVSEVNDSLRAAMNHAVSVISGDMYGYALHSRILLGALAELLTDEVLSRVLGSIRTVPLTAEQMAAIQVAGRNWGHANAPQARDLPGRDLRSAMIGAIERLSEIHNAEESEIERLGAAGDRAGQERIWRQQRERWMRGTSWRRGLSRVLGTIGDTLALPALAAAAPGSTLVPFGEAAIAHAVAVLRSANAHREQKRSLLADLAKIASGALTAENRRILGTVAHGFLNGETLGEKGLVSDGQGRVIEPAIDLALALEAPALTEILERLAADPGQLARFGVAPQRADELVWRLRERIAWSPVSRSPEQLLTVLRTIPSSPRPTLSHREAAVQLEGMSAQEMDETLRSAMIDAWAHMHMGTRSVANRWYHVRTPLENVLVGQYAPADVVSHLRALVGGESGPDQDLAIEAARRWRDEAPEDARVALIEALEHLNRENPDTGRRAVRGRHHGLAIAVDLLADSRAVPTLVRAGYPMVCATTGTTFPELAAEELARAVIGETAPPWFTEKGLTELGIKSAGGGFRRFPERTQALVLAAASRFLDGGARTISASVTAEDRMGILKAALYLAVATADERLSNRANRLVTDVAAVEALGLDRTQASDVSAYARELLAARPLMGPWDC
ncbi:hypothetical protein [Candidatus Palauibacter sp.]|uniref:hypothetical protein n=1 Tax=Candidatus Palauibacter sp. TaxID=3101350 RepID=UPI003CC5CF13